MNCLSSWRFLNCCLVLCLRLMWLKWSIGNNLMLRRLNRCLLKWWLSLIVCLRLVMLSVFGRCCVWYINVLVILRSLSWLWLLLIVLLVKSVVYRWSRLRLMCVVDLWKEICSLFLSCLNVVKSLLVMILWLISFVVRFVRLWKRWLLSRILLNYVLVRFWWLWFEWMFFLRFLWLLLWWMCLLVNRICWRLLWFRVSLRWLFMRGICRVYGWCWMCFFLCSSWCLVYFVFILMSWKMIFEFVSLKCCVSRLLISEIVMIFEVFLRVFVKWFFLYCRMLIWW